MPKPEFEPCIPTKASKVPDRPEWIREIKHDGYGLIVQRDGKRLRCSRSTAMTGAPIIRSLSKQLTKS